MSYDVDTTTPNGISALIELGILADDLTGGMMAASLLEREGVECPLVTSIDGLADLSPTATAVVVARKIRGDYRGAQWSRRDNNCGGL